MSKTLEELAEELAEQFAEELAEEFATDWHKDCDYPEVLLKSAKAASKTVFRAGYQAAKDQVADADKVMNSSNNLNGWISVKDRLPPDGAKVLLIVFGDIHYGWIDQSPSDPTEYCLYFSNTYIDKGHHALTHWMPIPSKPKYMSDYVEYEAPKEAK